MARKTPLNKIRNIRVGEDVIETIFVNNTSVVRVYLGDIILFDN